ncbi:NACHT domain-containing protein [Glycomyces salinus]|uniref:NACHT domain-containing protein n=1 Tax=Glycomyces salinus TaxID=980294 RepID=UPI0018ECF59D|nr:NACHT domain-containing protein [Glycomyces salinus]
MTDEQEQEQAETLAQGLLRLAQLGLVGALKESNERGRKADSGGLGRLFRVVQTLHPDKWNDSEISRVQAIRAVLHQAISGSEFDVRVRPNSTVTFRDAVSLLYGLTSASEDELNAYPRKQYYSTLIAILQSRMSYQGDKNFYRITNEVRNRLAFALKDLIDASKTEVSPRSNLSPLGEFHPQYQNDNDSEHYFEPYFRRNNRTSLDTTAKEVTEKIADKMRQELRAEERLRRLQDPFPLPVTVKGSDNLIIDHWANIRMQPNHDAPIELSGKAANLKQIFDRIPSGRMVVLGEAGSGKSILANQFALAILEDRERNPKGTSIPIVFQLWSWNPMNENLRDWMADTIVRDYFGRAESRRRKRAIKFASTLISSGCVFPILDGLDEIAPSSRQDAIADINRSFSSDEGYLLTSRPEEYKAAVQDDVLTAAAVVEVQELSFDEIAAYLPLTAKSLDTETRLTKWDPVLDYMRSNPNDAHCKLLLEALSTPLIVSLARANYSETDKDPGEMLDSTTFRSVSELKNHLLDILVDSLYSQLRNDNSRVTYGSRPHKPNDARKWFSYQAAQLHFRQTRTLHLWDLGAGSATPFVLLAIASAVVVASLSSTFIAIAMIMLLLPHLFIKPEAFASRLRTGLIPNYKTVPPATRHRDSLRRTLDRPPSIYLIFASMYVVAYTLIIIINSLEPSPAGTIYVQQLGGVIIVGFIFLTTLSKLATESIHNSPFRSMQRFRIYQAVSGVLAVIPLIAVTAIEVRSFEPMLIASVIVTAYCIIRLIIFDIVGQCWLALTRRGPLPWNTNKFVSGAHRMGIFRVSAGSYQFRHSLLQDRLARWHLARERRFLKYGSWHFIACVNLCVELIGSGRSELAGLVIEPLRSSKIPRFVSRQTKFDYILVLRACGKETQAESELRRFIKKLHSPIFTWRLSYPGVSLDLQVQIVLDTLIPKKELADLFLQTDRHGEALATYRGLIREIRVASRRLRWVGRSRRIQVRQLLDAERIEVSRLIGSARKRQKPRC